MAALRADFLQRLRAGPTLLLDGATGTELERRGVRSELPLWSTHALLEAPAVLESVHREYVQAGAEAITANTFRTQERTLGRVGFSGRAAELTERAVVLARSAAPAAWVLGSAPPLEDCYRPDLVPDASRVADEQRDHVGHLARAGVDAILAETHNTAREAAAVAAAASEHGLAVVVSFICGPGARLLSGEGLAEAIARVAPHQPCAIGVNCLPPADVEPCLGPLAAAGLPFGVQANLGAPGARPDAPRQADCSPDAYAEVARQWVSRGARFVGGCCGITPAHIRALAAQLSA